MEPIAYHDAGPGVALGEQPRHGFDALEGCFAATLGQDLGGRHALLDQVVLPHARLGETRIAPTAAGGDDDRRETSLLQGKGVVQSRLKNERGRAVVLRRAQNHNGVCGPGFVEGGLLPDGTVEGPLGQDHRQRQP